MSDQNWMERVKVALKTELVGKHPVTLLTETYLTCTEGTSNKFHLFVLYKYDNPTQYIKYIAGNAFGRIGNAPQGCVIEEGCERYDVECVMNKKIQAKKNKGYKSASANATFATENEMITAWTNAPKAKAKIKTVQPLPEIKVARRKFDLSI